MSDTMRNLILDRDSKNNFKDYTVLELNQILENYNLSYSMRAKIEERI